MVLKESGFNQWVTVYRLCVTWRMLADNVRRWRTYTNAAFLSSRRHNLSSKLKYDLSRWPGSAKALVTHAKVTRWRHCLIHYISCSNFHFCLKLPCQLLWLTCKGVQWCSMWRCISLDISFILALTCHYHRQLKSIYIRCLPDPCFPFIQTTNNNLWERDHFISSNLQTPMHH